MIKSLARTMFSRRTRRGLLMDWERFKARWFQRRNRVPPSDKLHLGCGGRHVAGWLNVDVAASQWNVDLACGRLPWRDASFSVVVSQHVIEHLDLREELLPLLGELHRMLRDGGQLWLSCPDMEKVCRAYAVDCGRALLLDRQTRFPRFNLDGAPDSQMINVLFHQEGDHKNLFDFELLNWALRQAGFASCRRVVEADLLHSFPEFPPRHDDAQSLYVVATRTTTEDAAARP